MVTSTKKRTLLEFWSENEMIAVINLLYRSREVLKFLILRSS